MKHYKFYTIIYIVHTVNPIMVKVEVYSSKLCKRPRQTFHNYLPDNLVTGSYKTLAYFPPGYQFIQLGEMEHDYIDAPSRQNQSHKVKGHSQGH